MVAQQLGTSAYGTVLMSAYGTVLMSAYGTVFTALGHQARGCNGCAWAPESQLQHHRWHVPRRAAGASSGRQSRH